MLEFLMVTIYQFLTTPYTVWFPVVVIGTLTIILILAMIVMFGSFTGNNRIRIWARSKAYEVLFSLILVFVFLFVIGFMSQINFVSIANAAHLVPTHTSWQNGCLGGPGLAGTDLTTLAVCDMYEFNNNIQSLNVFVYVLGLRFSFVPQVNIDLGKAASTLTGINGLGVSTKWSPVPSALSVFSGYLLDAMYTAFVFSQVQLLLLAASLLLFSVLLTVGLLARIFVLTRSFGGAMIALGIGMGIVYPLLVSVTYGYLDVGMQYNYCAVQASGFAAGIGGIVTIFIALVLQGVGVGVPIPLCSGNWLISFFQFSGYAGLGLIFVPILNFLIVDVFVLDFSQAVGERMDFMSLVSRLV